MQKSLLDMEDGPQKESVKIFDIFSLLQDPLQDLLYINGWRKLFKIKQIFINHRGREREIVDLQLSNN